jgi:hypothetical protein
MPLVFFSEGEHMNALRTIALVLLMASPTLAGYWPLLTLIPDDRTGEHTAVYFDYEWTATDDGMTLTGSFLAMQPREGWSIDQIDYSFTATVTRISEQVSTYAGWPEHIVFPVTVRHNGEILSQDVVGYRPTMTDGFYDFGTHDIFWSDSGIRYPFVYSPAERAETNYLSSDGFLDFPTDEYAAGWTGYGNPNHLCGLGILPDVLPGDFNSNREVQFSDFVILANNFGNAGNWSSGDANCDGIVQFPDFVILANNFGRTAYSAASTVPEPAAYVLMLLTIPLLRRSYSKVHR